MMKTDQTRQQLKKLKKEGVTVHAAPAQAIQQSKGFRPLSWQLWAVKSDPTLPHTHGRPPDYLVKLDCY